MKPRNLNFSQAARPDGGAGDDTDTFSSDHSEEQEDGQQTFQISVSIGGQKKQIQALINSEPEEIANSFILEHGVDTKLLDTLSKLITD